MPAKTKSSREQIHLPRKCSMVRLRRFISGDDAMLPAQSPYQGRNPLPVFDRKKSAVGISRLIQRDKARKMFLQKRHEYFLGAGLQKKRDRGNGMGAGFRRGTDHDLQVPGGIGDSRKNRRAIDAGWNSSCNEFPHRVKA